MHAKSLQLCPTLCNPMDYSLSGSSLHGILQARILELVALPYSRGSSLPRNRTGVSYVACTDRWVLYQQCHLGSPHGYIHIYNIYIWHSTFLIIGIKIDKKLSNWQYIFKFYLCFKVILPGICSADMSPKVYRLCFSIDITEIWRWSRDAIL